MIYLAILSLFALAAIIIFFMTVHRYKRCPSDKILVIYGKTGKDEQGHARTAHCVHGGAAFVWPLIQDYAFMSLTPIPIDIDLRAALSKQNIRINVPSVFTVGISTENAVMQNAAERLLGLPQQAIKSIAEDIILGQLRLTIAMMDIEEINADRDKFLKNVSDNVETELKKVGLRLINVNIKDLIDESGYLEALGKEAAAHAINEAKVKVSEKERDGEIGQAEADREKRIRVAAANAAAVEGENKAAVAIANTSAERKVKEAEAARLSTAAAKVQAARAAEEQYEAEAAAEAKRGDRDRATQRASAIVIAEIEKEKTIIAAEAEAERARRESKGRADASIIAADARGQSLRLEAKGQGDATYEQMLGQAKGQLENLTKQADGLTLLVKAAGGDADKAAMLLIIQQLPEIAKIQVEAVKNIKLDHVVVWDNGSGGKPGKTTTDFVSGMVGVLPQFHDLFKMVGLQLPEFFGKKIDGAAGSTAVPAPAAGPPK